VESHLILSVGDECYLALAKGFLTTDHTLILPINHTNSEVTMSPEAVQELRKFKNALRKYCRENTENPQSIVFYERNISTQKGNHHMHIQAIPVKLELETKVKSLFMAEAEKLEFKFQELEATDATSIAALAEDKNYLQVELFDGSRLVHVIEPDDKPKKLFHFARTCIAQLLGHPEWADWRVCTKTRQQEDAAVEIMKEAFKPYDFADVDDSEEDSD
jgi:hypothetical protein